MSQEATKSEYVIALVGLVYIGAFTAAEQAAELGSFAYRQVRHVLGNSGEEQSRTPPKGKATTKRR